MIWRKLAQSAILPPLLLCAKMLPEEEAMRLGFALQVLGRPGLKPSDTRRWQSDPHLSVSLAYLRDILAYLHQIGVRM